MNHRIALMQIREGPLCRGISPMLAALLTLHLSGCAFHSYQSVDRSEWPLIEGQKEVRVTMTDSTVRTGQLAELRLAHDSASLVDSSILVNPDGPLWSGTLILTNRETKPTDTVGFRRTKVVTDSTVLTLSEVARLEVQKGATGANIALGVAALALVATVFVVAVGIAMGDAIGEAVGQAYSGQHTNGPGQ
jgi:hypothetical protein